MSIFYFLIVSPVWLTLYFIKNEEELRSTILKQ